MADLATRTCVPCKGGVPPLKGEELAKLSRQLPGWIEILEWPSFGLANTDHRHAPQRVAGRELYSLDLPITGRLDEGITARWFQLALYQDLFDRIRCR